MLPSKRPLPPSPFRPPPSLFSPRPPLRPFVRCSRAGCQARVRGSARAAKETKNNEGKAKKQKHSFIGLSRKLSLANNMKKNMQANIFYLYLGHELAKQKETENRKRTSITILSIRTRIRSVGQLAGSISRIVRFFRSVG